MRNNQGLFSSRLHSFCRWIMPGFFLFLPQKRFYFNQFLGPLFLSPVIKPSGAYIYIFFKRCLLHAWLCYDLFPEHLDLYKTWWHFFFFLLAAFISCLSWTYCCIQIFSEKEKKMIFFLLRPTWNVLHKSTSWLPTHKQQKK